MKVPDLVVIRRAAGAGCVADLDRRQGPVVGEQSRDDRGQGLVKPELHVDVDAEIIGALRPGSD